jgi:methylated-DNA-[protein]-cysteine S-methyltransferase
MRFHTIPSPIGELLLTAEGEALTGLYMEPHPRLPATAVRDPQAFASAEAQLAAYFAGSLTSFDLPLDPSGTPFQLRVWEALRSIPYGETATYAELAAAVGKPSAFRAVGAANGRNPISVIVPCHRVIGADGTLTGYGGGLERKRMLLELEAGIATLAS